MLQRPVCKMNTGEQSVRGSATLEAFVCSPASPAFMNDFDSLELLASSLTNPQLGRSQRSLQSRRFRGVKKVWLKDTEMISPSKISSVPLRKISYLHNDRLSESPPQTVINKDGDDARNRLSFTLMPVLFSRGSNVKTKQRKQRWVLELNL